MRKILLKALFCTSALAIPQTTLAQELEAKVVINRAQVSDTKGDVFESLEKKLTDFLNDQKWTDLKLKDKEKIQCNFNITVNTYSDTDNSFTCTLLVTSSRPVYNTTYMTTAFSNRDPQFNFNFQEHDRLEFRPEQIDNQLVALMAYYAYMIIGIDLDTMSPMGGTDILHRAEEIVTAGQTLDYPGWKAFDDNKNRFGLLNDYLDGSMEKFRELQYQYHRKGLDQMAENPDTARARIAESLELLSVAKKAKSKSHLPQLFSEYKREELINLFAKKGTPTEKEKAHKILFAIDPSQSAQWEKIKK